MGEFDCYFYIRSYLWDNKKYDESTQWKRHLNPNNFNVEIFLRFNLGPLHKLDGLVAEIFAFNSKKSYVREEKIISQLPSGDPAKSNAISTFEKKDETKSRLPESFWDSSSSKWLDSFMPKLYVVKIP